MTYYLFLYCKDTTKSNNRQIICGKSYQKGYYLTFINTKIKDYYIITCFLLLSVLLFIVSLYYIYTLLYIEENKSKQQSKQGRRKGRQQSEQERKGKQQSKQKRNGREEGRAKKKGTRTKDAADLFTLSAAFTVHTLARSFPSVFLFLALSFLPGDCPAIAGRSPGPALTRAGRGPPRPALVVMSSPPPRHHRAADRQQGRADLCPPSRSPCRPSTPCRGASAYMRTLREVGRGSSNSPRAARVFVVNQSSQDNLHKCIALNIN